MTTFLCYSIKVQGKVQGVFYRKSTLAKAQALGIKGVVMNQPDGTVYIEAEGAEQELTEFLKWCEQGPANARVTEVEYSEIPMKNFMDFSIKR